MMTAVDSLETILQTAADGIVLIDAGSYRLLFANAAFCRMLGYSVGQIAALRVMDLHPEREVEKVLREFDRHTEGRTDTFRVLRSDGTVFFADITLAYFDSAQGRCVAAFFRDTAVRHRNEQRTRLPMPTDALTGLANRREFIRILELEMDRARRYGTPVGVLVLELDAFERVNDDFGQETCDRVLLDVSRITTQSIRSTDVAARWSTVAFAVMTPYSNLYAATRVAEKLRAAIARHPFDKAGKLTACVGVTEFSPGESASALLERVDTALGQARAGGSDRVEAVG